MYVCRRSLEVSNTYKEDAPTPYKLPRRAPFQPAVDRYNRPVRPPLATVFNSSSTPRVQLTPVPIKL
jgi:hypothetical protein